MGFFKTPVTEKSDLYHKVTVFINSFQFTDVNNGEKSKK